MPLTRSKSSATTSNNGGINSSASGTTAAHSRKSKSFTTSFTSSLTKNEISEISSNINNKKSNNNKIISSSTTPKLPPINNNKKQSNASSSLSSSSSSRNATPQSKSFRMLNHHQSSSVASSSSSSVSQTQSQLQSKLVKHSQNFNSKDTRPILTMEVDNQENSVFASLADLLFNNNYITSSTSPSAAKQQQQSYGTESKWIMSRVKITSSKSSSSFSANNPFTGSSLSSLDSTGVNRSACCIQLSGINLYLGAKTTTERLVTEAGLVCNRVRRNGGHMPVCSHMTKKDQIPDSEYTSYPNRILVAFFPGSKPITLKANMAKSLCDHFGPSFAFNHICPESYIVIPRKEMISDNFSGGNTSVNTTLTDQRSAWFKSINNQQQHQQQQQHDDQNDDDQQQQMWIAKVSHGAKGRQMKIIDARRENSNTATTTTTGSGNGGGGNSQQYFQNLAIEPRVFLTQLDRNLDSNPWVIQKYIDRPLLYQGRKFDLRAWVLLTPRLEIFLYKEGVCRMCSVEYNESNYNDVYAHLSNNCLQEKHSNFGKFEKGNLLSFQEMNDRLISKMKRSDVVDKKMTTTTKKKYSSVPSKFLSGGGGISSLAPLSSSELPHKQQQSTINSKHNNNNNNKTMMSFDQDVLPQMKRIIGNCFSSIKNQILPVYEQGAIDCFQYFGFDFMLDADLKLWLLEVNGAAGVADYLLKPTVEDLAETVIYDMLPQARPQFGGSCDRTVRPNWFEKIYGKDDW